MNSQEKAVDPMDIPMAYVTLRYTLKLIIAVGVFLALDYLWSEEILFSIHSLVSPQLSLEGLAQVWFIFGWAALATTLFAVAGLRYSTPMSKAEQLARGAWISLHAGVFEELIYRLFFFLSAMPVVVFVNFVTFGFIEWLDTEILLPIANVATFGALEAQLLSDNWVIGGAVIFAVASFRDEHKYLGFIGWVNSWFIGMAMFYLLFNYGLITAIVAHVCYDLVVFSIRAMASRQLSDYSFLIDRLFRD